MVFEVSEIVRWGSILFAGGAAWGGAKVALNGTRKKVIELENMAKTLGTELRAHERSDERSHVETIDRLARIETKLDMYLNNGRET